MWWVVSVVLRPVYPQERPGTHCIGGWVGPRAGLDGCWVTVSCLASGVGTVCEHFLCQYSFHIVFCRHVMFVKLYSGADNSLAQTGRKKASYTAFHKI